MLNLRCILLLSQCKLLFVWLETPGVTVIHFRFDLLTSQTSHGTVGFPLLPHHMSRIVTWHWTHLTVVQNKTYLAHILLSLPPCSSYSWCYAPPRSFLSPISSVITMFTFPERFIFSSSSLSANWGPSINSQMTLIDYQSGLPIIFSHALHICMLCV